MIHCITGWRVASLGCMTDIMTVKLRQVLSTPLHNLEFCSSRKYPYLPHGRSMEKGEGERGGGVAKGNVIDVIIENYGAKFEFPKGLASIKKKPSLREVWISSGTTRFKIVPPFPFAVKIPQIIKIIQAASVEGLSLSSFLLELIAITATASYSLAKGFPFRY